MSKLTEIKERLGDLNRCRGHEYYDAKKELDRHAETDIGYLILLLEKKDDALKFLAADENWSWTYEGTEDETVNWVGGTDPQHAARTALNTTKEVNK